MLIKCTVHVNHNLQDEYLQLLKLKYRAVARHYVTEQCNSASCKTHDRKCDRQAGAILKTNILPLKEVRRFHVYVLCSVTRHIVPCICHVTRHTWERRNSCKGSVMHDILTCICRMYLSQSSQKFSVSYYTFHAGMTV
jgi:hypothetical protein